MINKKKKYKFAIFVDEHGRERLHLKKLIELLEDKYPYLKQAGRCNRERLISNAKVKDVIVFGAAKRSDFAVVSAADYDDLTDDRRFTLVNLQGNFKKVKKLLARYAEANYPGKFEKEDYYCCNRNSSFFFLEEEQQPSSNWWDDVVVLDVPKPKKRRSNITVERPISNKKRKNATHLEEVSVHHNFVKVGFDVFDIDETIRGDEFVKIDGSTYFIDRDSFGNGILSTK